MGFKDLFTGLQGDISQNNSNTSTATANENPLVKEEEAKNSALNLAFKDINLFQAEKNGFTLWRLKAEWANMQEVDGLILVEQPVLVYYLENNEDITIRSKLGEVDQAKKILRFMNEVHVISNDNEMFGELLIYADEKMTMPEGGRFQGKNSSGLADFIVWDMSTQNITAEGNVIVEFGTL